jgi:hypothetical protein
LSPPNRATCCMVSMHSKHHFQQHSTACSCGSHNNHVTFEHASQGIYVLMDTQHAAFSHSGLELIGLCLQLLCQLSVCGCVVPPCCRQPVWTPQSARLPTPRFNAQTTRWSETSERDRQALGSVAW